MGGWGDPDDGEPEDAEPPANLPAPWEQPDYAATPENPQLRPRHNAFTPARRAKFLKRLAKYGCLADAARRTGVSTRTVYNHQDKDEAFARDCAHALRMAGSELEQVAFERAVEGIDQLFACGGQVHVRKRYSDALLRILLMGADRKKYGPHPGFPRKRLYAWERKRIDREVRAKIAAEQPSFDDAMEMLSRKLDAMAKAEEPRQLAEGWTKAEDGRMIPPGWVRAAAPPSVEATPEVHETPRDSMRKS